MEAEEKKQEELKEVRWEEMAKRLQETAAAAQEKGAGPEAEQVKEALDGLFAELKKLSDNAQKLAEKMQGSK